MEKGENRTASIKLTLTKLEEKDQMIKQGIWFRGRRHRTDNFVEIILDTVYSTCCHWGHITLQCPNRDRPQYKLCAELYTTRNHKCEIPGYPARGERSCRHTLVKWAHCKGTHYVTLAICPSQK